MAIDAQTLTLELPLTPPHSEALRHHIRSERQWFLGCVAFSATFAGLLPLIPVLGKDPFTWDWLMILGYIVGLALVMDWFFWRRPLEATIRHGVYLRATGPIRIFTNSRGRASVHVGDVRIGHLPAAMYSELCDLPWGTVDCVPRLHAVIEQRDADGELLHRYAAYRPDADRFDVRPMPSIITAILCGIGSGTLAMLCMLALVTWIVGHR
jgi:hypothetical protein